ncbi:MAG: AAA family ATPase [Armatimonadetes bacterium RBG_19FT_COMBO_69_19]|nr:MAG: AAA family ATPase [Armatimonadetes bacterium RBG_19FT_COMBO_69_19]
MTPEEFAATFERIRREVRTVIVGHETLIDHVLTAFIAGGHVLLEGVPGLGKTLLVKTLAQSLELSFSRIQFTPDLMPADIVGTNVVMQDAEGRRYFEFQRGPVFTQVLLADEVNRATPKTQSALLEAMQEHTVTAAGTSYALEEPFFVLATQNPIEMEGTYPLPEAQLDRFLFKVKAEFPTAADLVEIIDRTTVADQPQARVVASREVIRQMLRLAREVEVASHVKAYTARLVRATHPGDPRSADMARRYVRYGASPRGVQALILSAKVRALVAGRANVSLGDLKALALPSLRHRIILNFEGEAEGIDADAVIQNALDETPELEEART